MSKEKLNLVFLDFEFNEVSEELVNLVSCVTRDGRTDKVTKFWLHNSELEKKRLAKHLLNYQVVVGYQCVAEARSFLSLNQDPLHWKWVDLFLEYRLLTNHNDRLQWGKQLVDGKVKYVSKPSPKWERSEEDSKTGFKATHSLAEATYKLTGEIRDTEEKNATRDLIISAPKKFTAEQREQILKYNADDVVFLPKLWAKVKEEIIEFCGGKENIDMDRYFEEAMWRGRYSAHTAIMESYGYPINVEATKNFSKQIPSILAECQRDINQQFGGDVKMQKAAIMTERLLGKPSYIPFRWNRRTSNFSWDQKATRLWLEGNVDTDRWMKTDKSKKFPEGQLSLSLEAWERVFQFKHDYPRNNFGAQMVRFLKLKQSLNGFSDTGGKRKNFWDSVGSDGRVRPYMNIYGAQSSRSQPGASGFMFLKPAWMRALVQPAAGFYMAGVDYGQQEFFLSGLESGDKNMIAAYLSGDPYLYGAKLAGAIPPDGTKESHKLERDTFKNTYLGILFGMSKYGLATKLTNDLGRTYTEDDAQEQIDLFEDTYPDYMEWKKELLHAYQSGEGIKLADGWMMGPDNDNPRSAMNVPIQGMGAVIMRLAVDMAVKRGCKVLFTLHDAIYIEDRVGSEEKIGVLMECMREAFQYHYKGTEYFETAAKIKLDPFAWGPDYPAPKVTKDAKGKESREHSTVTVKVGKGKEEIEVSNLYLDERAMTDYNRFSIYFETPDTDLL
jgi:hypothetical protein